MPARRGPFRDPRTVARDIPGVLDVLFPRLSGGLVTSLNRNMFHFSGISALSEDRIEACEIQKSMLFEIAVVRTEMILSGTEISSNWSPIISEAVARQRLHFDARIPDDISGHDIALAEHASNNLLSMLESVRSQYLDNALTTRPKIPGLGWISSGVADFAVGSLLIEVKHTDRNFIANDFRQILAYWLLKYSANLERDEDVWSDCLLLNPRRNSALLVKFDDLLLAGSAGLNRIDALELFRSILSNEIDKKI